jgi:hypothetical protein
MPGKLLGSGTVGTVDGVRRADRWLNFWYAWPPERDIRDREDAPGARNPYNLWSSGNIVGGEETGMWPFQVVVYDDDIRFGGQQAGSYSVAGVTLDSAGVPLPGCTVELWLTNPDWPDAHQPLLIGTTTSDANGMYGFAVPQNTSAKIYKVEAYDGSRGGVTVRNLTGA